MMDTEHPPDEAFPALSSEEEADASFYPFGFYLLLTEAHNGQISFEELTSRALAWAERTKAREQRAKEEALGLWPDALDGRANGDGTAKRTRKRYTPEFKFQVVLESLQRDTTIKEVCRKFRVSQSLVYQWRQAFQHMGPEVFASQRDPQAQTPLQHAAPEASLEALTTLRKEPTTQNGRLKPSRRSLEH